MNQNNTHNTNMRLAFCQGLLNKIDKGLSLNRTDNMVASAFKRSVGKSSRNKGWSVSR